MNNNQQAKQRACSKRWRTRDPVKTMLYYAKVRCRRKKIPYDDISPDDIQKPTHCPVFGMELNYQCSGRWAAPNTASLDRIVPAKGYVKGNVRIISWQANRLKGAWTLEELEQLVAYIKSNRT